jgi:hypothetical protein
MSIYIKMFFKFVHYAYMYRMHDVFLFCVHVVVDVDDFFVLCFSQSRLVVVCYRFIITLCFDKYSFCCLSFLLFYFISSILMVGESLCKSLYCTVLYCTVLSSESTELFPRSRLLLWLNSAGRHRTCHNIINTVLHIMDVLFIRSPDNGSWVDERTKCLLVY